MTTETSDFVRVKEAVKATGMPRETILLGIKAGHLPFDNDDKYMYIVSLSAIRKAMAERAPWISPKTPPKTNAVPDKGNVPNESKMTVDGFVYLQDAAEATGMEKREIILGAQSGRVPSRRDRKLKLLVSLSGLREWIKQGAPWTPMPNMSPTMRQPKKRQPVHQADPATVQECLPDSCQADPIMPPSLKELMAMRGRIREKELAALLLVTHGKLRKWVTKGCDGIQLPPPMKIGEERWFEWSDVQWWLKELNKPPQEILRPRKTCKEAERILREARI